MTQMPSEGPSIDRRRLLRHVARAFAVALGLCALAAAPSTQPVAQTSQPADQTAQATTQSADAAAGLIAQLDDPDFGIRQSAEQKLNALGPSIEPALKLALNQALSDEARARINHLIRVFDEARAMHASITLHYTNAPAIKVLTDFATQAGAPMGTDEPAIASLVQDRLVTINLDNAGFWEGLQAIDQAVHLTPSLGPNGVTFAGAPGRIISDLDLSNPLVHVSNGILFECCTSDYNRMKNYIGIQPSFTMVNFQLMAIPEPRLRVIGMGAGNWIKQCVDEKGNSLVQEGFNRRFFMPRMPMRGPRMWQFPLQVSFREFPGMGTHIAKLVGELNISVETHGITTEIKDITRAANTTKDDGQIAVTVLSVTRTNMSYQLELQIRGATLNDPVYQEFLSTVDLLDERGQSIPRQSTMPRMQPDGIRLTLGFLPTQQTPATLQWQRVLDQKHIVVPFEMDNLPPW